ncbi:MAG: hypothetical protein GXO26_07585 [Crenarchaeota archaeon]|nr:hypothetical protein [Thermoproteota archaeon]
MRLIVVHVDEEETRRGIIVRIFTIPYKSVHEMTYLDMLTLGNLKLLKSYDFWINADELPDRISGIDILRSEDLLYKIVEVCSAGGRIMSMRIVGEYDKAKLEEFASRPVGIRVIGDRASIAFSDTLYVSVPCKDFDIDIKLFKGQVEKVLIGSSVKNYFRSLEILKEVSEKGELTRRKVVLLADFVRELPISV